MKMEDFSIPTCKGNLLISVMHYEDYGDLFIYSPEGVLLLAVYDINGGFYIPERANARVHVCTVDAHGT